MKKRPTPRIAREIIEHYETGPERTRLFNNAPGQMERLRTQELLRRLLPKRKLDILDVGGGMGVHAFPLADMGHRVTLTDPAPLHIRTARRRSEQSKRPLTAVLPGDARKLDFPSASFDGVLILGPLYHLVTRRDRLRALQEARRVLRPGGILMVAAVSRYAPLLDGFVRGYLADSRFQRIVWKDLKNGQHKNPSNDPNWFTTAYLHLPDELKTEVTQAGFKNTTLYSLEGPAWLTPEIERQWRNPKNKTVILNALRRVETHMAIMALSAHFVAVGRKGKENGEIFKSK